MSESRSSPSPVLGQAALQRQPRMLPRPIAGQLAAVVPIEGHAAVEAPADARADGWCAGEAAGRHEGRQMGMQEGRRQGLEEGREEGLRQGLQLAREKLEAEIEAVNAAWRQREAQLLQLLQAIPAQLADRLEEMEDDMVALAHAAVLRILGDAFQSGEGPRLAVRRQIDGLERRQVLVVRVHPDDACLLRDDVQIADLGAQGVTWVADERVATGGCIMETRDGSLDARLETQLQAFTQLLLSTRRSRLAEREGGA
ncbi:hypothetical protein G5S34_20130 [Herbaspirillum frisingense]|uniref:FliH/SctL family protein n=1 Tax=Herbaspirillum frisingense TaxID=92645 RepID=UPI0015FFC7A0|nr:FliH/SctL family protein [Herbaspirillum frisingense]QNB08835.1 hypothetical protein G5S34_20130 [Herbaspirillum frisingense]